MRNGEIRKRRIRTIALCGTLAQVLTATVAAAQKRMCKRMKRQQSFKHYMAPRELASQPARFEGQPARPKGSPFRPEDRPSKCKGLPSRPKGQPAWLNSQSVRPKGQPARPKGQLARLGASYPVSLKDHMMFLGDWFLKFFLQLLLFH